MKSMMVAVVAALCAVHAHGGMCKMPTCKEPAIERSQFCERHTCATKGCYAGVKIGGVPGWVQGKVSKKRGFGSSNSDDDLPTRIVWRHCPKHCCGRVMPRLANPNTRGLIKNATEDELLEILACSHERLNKGKFCLRHSCGVSNCSSAVLEEWSDRVRKSSESEPEKSDLTTHEFCPRHLSAKGNNKMEREGVTKETCSENYERKLAEKQERLEKQKAEIEKQRAAQEERRKAAAAKKAAQADNPSEK